MSDQSISRAELDALRHDVRSPLMVIGGFARLLAAEREVADEDRRKYARRIEDAVADVRRIIDDALG